MIVHVLLTLLLILWGGKIPQGAAEEVLRDVGIVLKRETSAGVKFDGEEDIAAHKTADINSPEPTVSAALPDLATHSAASEALPTLPGPGLMAGAEGNPGAGEMTQGGGTRGGARGEIGEQTTTSVFGVPGTGSKFVYVFDRSASMEGAPLAAAKQQLLASLDSLEEIHRFHIIFFNSSPPLHAHLNLAGGHRIAFADSQNKMLAKRFVESIEAFGGTDRATALLEAMKLSPDVVFFLSDADDEMSPLEIGKVLDRSRRSGTSISTIQFGRGVDPQRDNFLKRIANETGGSYGYVDANALKPAGR